MERDNAWNVLNYITPEEVESVSVLRDAAALALYGYKGVNGVLNIVTKRGKYKSKEINFKYDHAINWQARKPELADAYTYANALNEALTNDGKTIRYSQNELFISTVYADEINSRSALTIGNSLYGNVLGLTTMQKTGATWEQMPSMYIRGLKTLNGRIGIVTGKQIGRAHV